MDRHSPAAPKNGSRRAVGLFIPGYLLPVYVLLLLALGWFSGQRWGKSSAPASSATAIARAAPAAAAAAAVDSAIAVASAAPSDTRAPSQEQAAQSERLPVDSLADGELPALRYSAHVYASEDEKRSITLNGQRYREGESPAPGLTIEQIQQDITLFSFNGEVFMLDALEDWSGGRVDRDEGTIE